MNISVIVPSYCRINDLRRCLTALQQQTYQPHEILVIVRESDQETLEFIRRYQLHISNLIYFIVNVPGVVAAMNVGLEKASGDILAFTDDDAAPHRDWLARLVDRFSTDSRIAGVGGRDWVYHGSTLEDGSEKVVGKVQWFGRVIGNHHIGVGEPREVDILKGVNMSFRRSAIIHLRFDPRMRGNGAQPHFEIMFSLRLRNTGWKLIYDPSISVDHFRGQRFDEDQRDSFNSIALSNSVHNETLSLLENLPFSGKYIFMLWCLIVGTRDSMGFLQWLRFFPSEGMLAGRKCMASLRGRWQGYQSWRKAAVDLPGGVIHLEKSL